MVEVYPEPPQTPKIDNFTTIVSRQKHLKYKKRENSTGCPVLIKWLNLHGKMFW